MHMISLRTFTHGFSFSYELVWLLLMAVSCVDSDRWSGCQYLCSRLFLEMAGSNLVLMIVVVVLVGVLVVVVLVLILIVVADSVV